MNPVPSKKLLRPSELILVTGKQFLAEDIDPADLKRLDVTTKRISVSVAEVVGDFWVEVPLQKSWIAAFRISAKGYRPRIAEVRVFPREDQWKNRPAGEWSALLKGVAAEAPTQGITKRLLSQVPVNMLPKHLEQVMRKLRADRSEGAEIAEKLLASIAWGDEDGETVKKSTRGRKPLTGEFLAQVAMTYVEGLKTGKPRKHVQQTYDVPAARAGGWVTRARQRGFLDEGLQGVTSGRLTPKAKLVLARMRRRAAKTTKKTAASSRPKAKTKSQL